MMQKMTVREKVLTAILGLLVLFCIYYFAFYTPTNQKIQDCINDNLDVEDQIILADAKAAKKEMMEAELEAIFAGEAGEVKELPAYDNGPEVMNQLSGILADSAQYDLSFSTVEKEDNTVRRGATLNYTCASYDAAKKILTEIHDSEYRSLFKNLSLGYNENESGGTYTVTVDIVYFEYEKPENQKVSQNPENAENLVK